jgi:RNA polymerase sigma factor (sigma-70 family)
MMGIARAPWRGRGLEGDVSGSDKLHLFEELMLPHLNAAHNLARWLTGNADEAQDIVQEAYLRAFRFFDGFHGGDGKAWLLAVVRNTSFTWRRQAKRKMTEPFDEATHIASAQPADQDEKLIDAAKRTVLQNCIETLPAEFREVLVMRELEEMSYQQISEAANLPVGTVMSRLSRARRRLEACANGWKVRTGK